MAEDNSISISAVVWPWRSKVKPPVPAQANHALRAVIQALVGGAVAALLYFYFKRPTAAVIVGAIAAVILISGLFIPPLFRQIDRFGQWLGRFVGTAVTWILLVPFYYLVFFPGRLLMLLGGKDPMARKFPTTEPTYWVPRPPLRNAEQYRKQH